MEAKATAVLSGTPKSVAMMTNKGEIPKRSTLEVNAASATAAGGRVAWGRFVSLLLVTTPPYTQWSLIFGLFVFRRRRL